MKCSYYNSAKLVSFEYKNADLKQEIRFFHELDVDRNGKLNFYEWIEVY